MIRRVRERTARPGLLRRLRRDRQRHRPAQPAGLALEVLRPVYVEHGDCTPAFPTSGDRAGAAGPGAAGASGGAGRFLPARAARRRPPRSARCWSRCCRDDARAAAGEGVRMITTCV